MSVWWSINHFWDTFKYWPFTFRAALEWFSNLFRSSIFSKW
jgi:hypothetical protein